MITSRKLYIVLSDIMEELKKEYALPDVEQATVSQWHEEYGSILHDADFDFVARHLGEAFLEERGADKDSKFTVNYFGNSLLVYKAKFPDGYLCHNLKDALIEALRSDVIDFEYEDLFHCSMLKESEFSELLEEVYGFVEPLDHPWYGAKTFYDELSGTDIRNAAVVCLSGNGGLDDLMQYIAVIDDTIIVTRKYFSSDMTISWIN